MDRKFSLRHRNPVLLVGVGILVLVLVGVLVWFLFFRPPVASTSPGPKPAAAGKMQERTNTPTVAQALPADRSTPPASPSNPRGPYKGFWYETNLTPERLAALVDAALTRNSSGTELIDEAKCARDGSCATPLNYLEAFQVYDRGAGLTHVSQLPAYIRKLVMDCNIKGRFMMADIYQPGSGRGRTETSRMSRFIKHTECVFKNPVTGQPVIAQYCANPVGKRIAPPPPPPPPCVTLTFHSKYYKEGKVHWGVGSTTGRLKDDACNAQRQGNGPWVRWSAPCDECIPPVNYLRRILGGTAQWVHTYVYGTTHRKQTLRFSTEVWTKVVYICLGRDDGSRTCGVYMRPQDWKGRHHVTIPDHLWLKDENNCPE